MKATPVSWPEVVDEYRAEFTEASFTDMNTRTAAERDLKGTTWRLKRNSKRRAAVEWSLPTEILLLALCPDYVSRADKSTAGIGSTNLKDLPNIAPSPAKSLQNILEHVRATNTAPIDATTSKGHLLDKQNQKEGMKGKRMIHEVCNFWKAFFWRAAVQRTS